MLTVSVSDSGIHFTRIAYKRMWLAEHEARGRTQPAILCAQSCAPDERVVPPDNATWSENMRLAFQLGCHLSGKFGQLLVVASKPRKTIHVHVGRSAASQYMGAGAGEKQTIEKKTAENCPVALLTETRRENKERSTLPVSFKHFVIFFESDFAAGLHPRKMGPRVGPGPPQSPGRWVCHARPSQTCTGRRIGRRTLSPAGGFAKERLNVHRVHPLSVRSINIRKCLPYEHNKPTSTRKLQVSAPRAPMPGRRRRPFGMLLLGEAPQKGAL